MTFQVFNANRILISLLLSLLTLGLVGFPLTRAFAEISLSDSVATEGVHSTDEYVDPFLVTKTSKKIKKNATEVISLVRSKLTAGQLGVRGTFSAVGDPVEHYASEKYSIPKGLLDDTQIEALKTCTEEKCLIKLNTRLEISSLKKSKNKTDTYHQLIFNRIKRYLESKELLGYEDRSSNIFSVKKMVALIPGFARNPKAISYFKTDFWKGIKGVGQPSDSWLRQEIVNIAPDQMQPVLRVSEVFEFHEGERVSFLELHIYSNHYFDSSISFYEVLPNRSVRSETEVVFTDVMEIDELKKTALIRAMFKGKMVAAVTTCQTQFLEGIATK